MKEHRTTRQIVNEAFEKVSRLDDGYVEIGIVYLDGEEFKPETCGLPAGAVPSKLQWTEDRGNWIWDGVMVAMRAAGLDVDSPLTDD